MRSIALLLLLALLAAPTSHALWRGAGETEPNTAADLSGFLFAGPPAAGQTAVYLQAFQTAAAGTPNPNAALLSGHVQSSPTQQFQAILGLWNDCNDDGYIGLSETGQTTYAARLLLATAARCPAGGLHNDGVEVRELVSLSPRAAPGALHAPGTLLWADRGLPGESGFESCSLLPVERGTTSRTGATLRAIDCASSHLVVRFVNEVVDPDCALGLCFEEEDHPQESGSALNRDLPVSLWGNPFTGEAGLVQKESGAPTATVWDCDGGAQVAADPAHASAWDAAVALLAQCDAETVERTNDLYAYERIEGPVSAPLHGGRSQNDVVFEFERDASDPSALVLPPFREEEDDHHAAVRAPVPLVDLPDAPSLTSGRWIGHVRYLAAPQTVERSSLEPSGAAYWTFYARVPTSVSAAGYALPGAVGTYGAEACAGHTHGVHNGWECDVGAWWTTSAGDARPRDADGNALGATPGLTYQLRDVDCFDGSLVGGAGVRASLADLSEDGPCATPPG